MLIAIVILLAAAALAAAGVYALGVRSQQPRRKPVDQFPPMPYENVSWSSSGQTIRGWFIPVSASAQQQYAASGSLPPLLIVAHGWGSSRASMLRYIPRLHEAGYALLCGDARSHGESGDALSASGVTFWEDMRAALDYASSRTDIDQTRIGVLGHSLGAFAGVLALAGGETRIRALVTDAMPARMGSMIASELTRRGLPKFPLVPLIGLVWKLRNPIPPEAYDLPGVIDSSATPLLLIHSRNDGFIPSSELDYVLERVRRPVEQLYVDCEGHSSSAGEDEFWTRVLPFLTRHLREDVRQG